MIIPVIIPENCVNHACDELPGWDWLWFLLITLGSIAVVIVLVWLVMYWLEEW